ncbi:MAG: hypothetical protein WC728_03350 [Elusimicrobiota bacterium]
MSRVIIASRAMDWIRTRSRRCSFKRIFFSGRTEAVSWLLKPPPPAVHWVLSSRPRFGN